MNELRRARWSLSEFLNMVELRSQTWCFVEMREWSGFRIPHNDAILFYAVMEGSTQVIGAAGEPIELSAGEVLMVLSGNSHVLRSHRGTTPGVLAFLHEGEYVDVPPNVALGRGRPTARLLCGRLKVRWPGGHHPPAIPPVLSIKSVDTIVDLQALEPATRRSGAAAILTRAASLLFTLAFRAHPQSEMIFRDSTLYEPIARARQLIETHPFIDWTVELLARKVGMGRSNFAARFVAEVGRTPIDFVTEERMKLAANFLEASDLKISEISERTGYRSEAAFSRRFTAHFGMSPGKMRKLWRRSQRQSAASVGSATLQ
jgi:AraC-like DNA-binding protein/mannose-6-phosphate isomerase-like protein (cupin superfamily)